MNQLWFLPLAVLIGLAGTHTASRSRHHLKAGKKERGRLLLLVLSWMPAVLWIVSQFVIQD